MFVTVVPGKAFVGLMKKEVVPGACLVWVGVSLCFIGYQPDIVFGALGPFS